MNVSRPFPAMSSRRVFLVGAAAFVFAPRGLAHGPGHDPATPAPVAAFELPQPLALKDFRLVDQRGRAFTLASFQGHWSMLLFGYTHCPDVCPTTLAQMAEVRRELRAIAPKRDVAGVFVTVDPARDTQAQLAAYVARFDGDFAGVGGDAKALRAFAGQFKVRYEPAAGAPYRFDHTASVAVLGPDARLYAVFALPLAPARVAADIVRLQDRNRGNA